LLGFLTAKVHYFLEFSKKKAEKMIICSRIAIFLLLYHCFIPFFMYLCTIINNLFMKIAIVGTGYVGLVSGTCFAEMGAHVTCVDVDTQKIEKLKNGIMPIYEPGLEELVKRNVEYGRLQFTTDLTEVLDDVEVVFSAVGTPPDEDGSADLKYVLAVARQFGQNINKYTILVTKSTVPVGTAKKVKAAIQEELDKRGVDVPFDVASNPEFLKEGAAIKDFMSPDRVVVGTESEKAKEVMTRLYKPFLINNFRVIFMDIPSAEMTKYAANAMLATRISFMNDIANLCERVGANVDAVRKGIGTDARIGSKFLYAGCGYGGSCFPKDVKALLHTGLDNGYHMEVIEAVERVNERQKSIVYDKIIKAVGSVKGKTVAIVGLSFKPETDDMREAPALVVIEKLLADGATIRVFDPIAMDECKRRIGDSVTYCKNMYDAADGADVFALMTEWRQFRMPSWNVVQKVMNGNVVVDGRNIYDRQELEEMGFVYTRIGEQ
jgi:UDPglucose 6-dehydrogenase